MWAKIGAILIFFSLALFPAMAQCEEISQYKIYDDLWEFVRHPNSILTEHQWTQWVIPTLALYAVDESLSRSYIDQVDTPIANYIATYHGQWKPDHALYWTLEILHQTNANLGNTQLQQLTFLGGEALWDATLLSQGLKHVFGRARPSANEGPYNWGRGGTEIFGPYTSFPSSHTTMYFAMGTIVGKVYGNEWLGDAAGIIYFMITTGHNHWLSDIWIGYLLGKAIGNYVWNKRHDKNYKDGWRVYPTFRPGTGGSLPMFSFAKTF